MANVDTYSFEGLEELMLQLGQARFRSVQLFEWLYGRGVANYKDMTNLPEALRARLADEAPLMVPTVADTRISADGTRKYILQLHDGALVETVGIPTGDARDGQHERLSVCVSTQVGCPMACSFCATGQEGFTRNLSPGEIVWQVLHVARDFGQRASNVVFMGQGEPFLNFESSVAALRMLNHAKGPHIGARHITVSTCGIADKIRVFGQIEEQFTLAISLHGARQSVRDTLMPRMADTPLPELKAALGDYQKVAKRRVSLEYLMIQGLNAREEDFEALVEFCAGLSVHVNLLPINAVDGSAYTPCSLAEMRTWATRLEGAGIPASVRTSRGADIFGACGQLKNQR